MVREHPVCYSTDFELSLIIGELRLDLAKENYERSGLVGKPIRDGGRKHMKTRYGKNN